MSISYVDCSNTFAQPLKLAAKGSPGGVGGEAALGVRCGEGPPLLGRKIFENLLKNVSDYFLSFSRVFKYGTEV